MYIGRFAPSPTGLLHAGSLVAALASWLDARSHHGRWLVRIEDIDTPRCTVQPNAIMRQLYQYGMKPDDVILLQSSRHAAYQHALAQLQVHKLCYPCSCSRSQITAAMQQQGHTQQRHTDRIYPGTCRSRNLYQNTKTQTWRLNIAACLRKQGHSVAHMTTWHDRCLGAQQQAVAQQVGDFILQRRDGLWAYQLAVVVDDAAQGITHIVRGKDLLNNTARQIVLQQALGVPQPAYLHTPLVLAKNGEKLSKQNGAQPLVANSRAQALKNLQTAANALGLPTVHANTPQQALNSWVQHWQPSCIKTNKKTAGIM